MKIISIALILVARINLGLGGVVPNPFAQYVSKKPSDDSQVGLYNEAPFVTSLTADSIKPKVYRQKYATYLEFYNSYCGFCRRFAPTWIALSQDLSAWKPNVMVAAIDCSVDTNSDTCREFEVMAYPTIRYFSPKYEEGEKKIGVEINKGAGTMEELRDRLVENLVAEEVDVPSWPNFQRQQQVDKDQLFATQPDSVKYVFFIFEPNATSTMAAEVILDFSGSRNTISVQRIGDSTDLLDEVELDRQKIGLLAVDRELTVTNVALTDDVNRTKIRDTINTYCSTHHVDVSTTSSTSKSARAESAEVTPIPSILDLMKQKQDEAIRDKVKESKGAIFQADIEQAVKYALFHEVARFATIDGERLLALQRFVNVIDRYFPFSENGRAFITAVKKYVADNKAAISGEDFLRQLQQLDFKHKPVFASSRWIGCQSDKVGLRRYPCGVWTLFHFLTVQAADSEDSVDPLEVLQAMHGYIKHFFGCSQCSQHFQDMAERNKIWSVSNKDDAVLWLWSAHNEVNKRLSKDVTEDPEYPKIQFPAPDVCLECRKLKIVHVKTLNYNEFQNNETIEWNKTEVLDYLKRIYIVANISRLGMDVEPLSAAAAARLQSTATFSNVFTDLDMRVGVLLYVFCIGMMIVAAKLFIRRGYRKKMYTHDLLGKV